MRLRFLVKTLTLVFAVFILASMSFGQTFPGAGVGSIPDSAACGPTPGTPLNITFNVTGVAGNVSNLSVDTTFGSPSHTWMGDVVATLIAPNATQFTVFGVTTATTATGIGDSSDLGGLYTFNNAATGNWWDAAALAGAAAVVPPGAYRTAALGGAGATNAPTDINAAFSTTPANGTWTLRVTDGCTGDTGAITAANLVFSNAGPLLPNLVINDVAVTEGNAGTTAANFTVTLSAAAAANVTVNFATADASATAPSDYTATSGTLTFTPGQVTKTVTVLVNGDTTFEPAETFQVNLTAPSANATIADNQGIGTINNDDAPPVPLCIFNNGGLNPQPLADNGTAAPAGFFFSEGQHPPGDLTNAAGAGLSALQGTFRIADNFTVPAGGCLLNTVSFFAYQTASPVTPSPFGAYTLQIWNGRPGDAGAAVIFGDTTTNRLASSVDTTFFRLFNSVAPAPGAAVGTTRKIWRNTLSVNTILPAGTYWLDWASAATNAGANFHPPTTIPGSRGPAGANARILTVATSTWADALDTGTPVVAPGVVQEFPFFLNTLVTNDAPVDFDGDGRTDFAVVRNIGAGASGATNQLRWFYNLSGTPGIVARDFGIATDRFVAEDFDGDGKDDLAVWRPAAATVAAFYILQSQTNTVRIDTFGQTGDDPTVVGDYDGDNRADVAVYRAGATGAQSTWFYRGSLNNPSRNISFNPWGVGGDFPAPGDYDGDGRNDFAIQRPAAVAASQANFWLRQTTAGNAIVPFGLGTDVIIPGDYDGDGKTDIATARGAAGAIQWQWQPSSSGAIQFRTFGASATDSIVQGDYDGDGRTDIAIWRPAGGQFWTQATSNNAISTFALGATGDGSVASFNTH